MNVEFQLNKSGKLQLDMYDLNGKRIMSKSIDGIKGNNKIEVDTRSFGVGYYFAKVSSAEESRTSKFMVVR